MLAVDIGILAVYVGMVAGTVLDGRVQLVRIDRGAVRSPLRRAWAQPAEDVGEGRSHQGVPAAASPPRPAAGTGGRSTSDGRRVPVADGRLPGDAVDQVDAGSGWWWLGVHGGAGVSTLAGWVPGGVDAAGRWPAGSWPGPDVVVLVCRADMSGLTGARVAVRQWAAGEVPRRLRVAGVVTVADAPGRLSTPQRQALRLLTGVSPQVWSIPWVGVLRATVGAAGVGRPPAVQRLAIDLAGLDAAQVQAAGVAGSA